MKKVQLIAMGTVLAAALMGAGTFAETVDSEEARSVLLFDMTCAEDTEGVVTVEHEDETEEGYVGMRLDVGDVVVTDENTAVYLRIDDDKNLRLSPNSSVELTEADHDNILITVNSGEMYTNVENKLDEDETMNFNVGGTTMSIRGTSLNIGYTEGEEVNLIVTDGHVAVAPEGSEEEPVLVDGGMTASMPENGEFKPEDLEVEQIDLEDLPNNVLMEIKNDEKLRERVVEAYAETTGRSVDEISQGMEKKLETVTGFDFTEKPATAASLEEKKEARTAAQPQTNATQPQTQAQAKETQAQPKETQAQPKETQAQPKETQAQPQETQAQTQAAPQESVQPQTQAQPIAPETQAQTQPQTQAAAPAPQPVTNAAPESASSSPAVNSDGAEKDENFDEVMNALNGN